MTDSDRAEKAVACFKEGFSCSQAVLSAFADEFGLDRDLALKVSAGFGAGMGRMAQTCGAVTGAIMVLGLRHGATVGQDRKAKENTYTVVREFVKRFTLLNGSAVCKDLLGCDISTPEGFQRAREKDLMGTRCTKFVRDAVEILEQLP